MAKRKNKKSIGAARNGASPKPTAAGIPASGCLSSCATRYVETLADPRVGRGACVPIPPCLPSRRLHVFVKGTHETSVTSSGAGFGFIQVSPYQAVANDATAMLVTDTDYPNASSPTAAGTGSVAFLSNSPYAGADISGSYSGVVVRLVSAGLYIKYAGTRLQCGGSVVMMCSPNNVTLTGTTVSGLLAFESATKQEIVPGKEYSAVWTPKNPVDFEFSTYGSLPTSFPLVAFITAPDATVSLAYDFEAHFNYEVVGVTSAGTVSSMPDPVGGPAAVAAANEVARKPSFNVLPPNRKAHHLKQVTQTVVDSFSAPALAAHPAHPRHAEHKAQAAKAVDLKASGGTSGFWKVVETVAPLALDALATALLI